jgi:hypothetical protein
MQLNLINTSLAILVLFRWKCLLNLIAFSSSWALACHPHCWALPHRRVGSQLVSFRVSFSVLGRASVGINYFILQEMKMEWIISLESSHLGRSLTPPPPPCLCIQDTSDT